MSRTDSSEIESPGSTDASRLSSQHLPASSSAQTETGSPTARDEDEGNDDENFEEKEDDNNKTSNVWIVGAVLGPVVSIIIMLVGVLLLRRRRARVKATAQLATATSQQGPWAMYQNPGFYQSGQRIQHIQPGSTEHPAQITIANPWAKNGRGMVAPQPQVRNGS